MNRADADALLRSSRFQEAVAAYRELLAHQPGDVFLRARLAESYERVGNLDRALHHYTRAATQAKADADLDGALRLYRAANRAAPREPEILQRICECLKAKDDDGLAPALTELAHQAESDHRRRLWAVGQLAELSTELLDPFADWLESVAESGPAADARRALEILTRREGPPSDRALAAGRRLAAGPSRDPDSAALVGRMLLSRDLPKEALALLAPYLEKFGEHVGVLESLTMVCDALGAHDRLRPLRIQLLRARAIGGDKAAALEDAEILLAEAGDDPDVIEICGFVFGTFNRRADAIPLWRRLERIAAQNGNAAQRERSVQALLSLDPDNPQTLELGVRARRLAGRHASAEALSQRLSKARGLGSARRAAQSSDGPSGKVFIDEDILLRRAAAPRRPKTRVRTPSPAPEPLDTFGEVEELGDSDVIEILEESMPEFPTPATKDPRRPIAPAPSAQAAPSVPIRVEFEDLTIPSDPPPLQAVALALAKKTADERTEPAIRVTKLRSPIDTDEVTQVGHSGAQVDADAFDDVTHAPSPATRVMPNPMVQRLVAELIAGIESERE